jgi:hypothetical protein
MLENLPFYINILFFLTILATLLLFFKGTNLNNMVLAVCLVWVFFMGFLAFNGFFLILFTVPPRIMFAVAPPMLAIILLFALPKGRALLDSFDAKWLTYLHTIRIPVEIILFLLFLNGLVPQIMTFEGRNFDIIAGITAPLVAYFGYTKPKLGKSFLIFWNAICLVLLFNIVINAALSTPSDFQMFAFDQPNIGVLYFPFILLPGFIVPVVLLSHLVCIRQLLKKK